ncbi:MAG: hypothetical protein H0U03_00320 [Actinobacteria bacterium]|nr:hypothetical protein [Actinomycetota bacterium]
MTATPVSRFLFRLCLLVGISAAFAFPAGASADPGTCDTTAPTGYALPETITVPTTGAG